MKALQSMTARWVCIHGLLRACMIFSSSQNFRDHPRNFQVLWLYFQHTVFGYAYKWCVEQSGTNSHRSTRIATICGCSSIDEPITLHLPGCWDPSLWTRLTIWSKDERTKRPRISLWDSFFVYTGFRIAYKITRADMNPAVQKLPHATTHLHVTWVSGILVVLVSHLERYMVVLLGLQILTPRLS